MTRSLLLAMLLLAAAPFARAQVVDVDPFIGVDAKPNWADGAVFPGATTPFGMLKAGPDMLGNDGNGGWKTGFPIDGFSQVHVSGTGGGSEYGNILVQPTRGGITVRGLGSKYHGEAASPGFFHVSLDRWGVDVDIAAARRSAIYRFRYAPTYQPNLVFDLAHILSSGADATSPISPEGEDQRLVSSSVMILSPTEVSGQQTVKGGWNKALRPYTVYFYGVTDTPARAMGIVDAGLIRPGQRAVSVEGGGGTGAYFSYPGGKDRTVQLRLGISFVSVAQAKASLAAEIPTFDFAAARARAEAEWARALSPVSVEGATPTQRKQLYTALYHMMLMPVDRTGENPLWRSSEPSYDDFYAIWDTFRSSSPFLALIAPDRERDIVRALVDIHAHEGWMPDARKGNYSGVVQGGSNCDVTVADALARGLTGIDWTKAYAAMRTNAETVPDDPMRVGRRGLADWKSLGYLTLEGSDMQGSRQVEYALNDWSVAQVARHLGREADYQTYLGRSANWRKLFDADFEHEGFKGFIRPRGRDGHWMTPFDPLEQRSQGYPGFYEGDSWTYSFYAPHDVAGLMAAMGGRDTFVRRLDHFFAAPDSAWPGSKRYNVGNEPGFLIPYLYIWAGRHDLTAARVRDTLANFFDASRAGEPGNDDSGAMSSWYALGLIGIYPNAGSDVWLIGSPSVPRTTLNLAGGKRFVIDAAGTSPSAMYVTGATLNGHPLDHAWLHHAEIARGGVLKLTMADKPGNWPQGAPPPSESDRAK